MKRIIIFLIRKRLGLKKDQRFTFDNQKSVYDEYYFTDKELMKFEPGNKNGNCYKPSSCSLNWLLDDACKITKVAVTHGSKS